MAQQQQSQAGQKAAAAANATKQLSVQQVPAASNTQNIQIMPKQHQRLHKPALSQVPILEQSNGTNAGSSILAANEHPSHAKQRSVHHIISNSSQQKSPLLQSHIDENQGAELKANESKGKNLRQASSALPQRPPSAFKANGASVINSNLNSTTIGQDSSKQH